MVTKTSSYLTIKSLSYFSKECPHLSLTKEKKKRLTISLTNNYKLSTMAYESIVLTD